MISLAFEEVLQAFAKMEELYPRVLPLTVWRAWEYAAYKHFHLPKAPVLDLGCGDGQFFHLVWGEQFPAVDGVDLDERAVRLARGSGVYRQVFHAPADRIPAPEAAYGAVFSNCALEHMDNINGVLAETYRVIRPGGVFLFSAVTDRLVAWAPLKQLLSAVGEARRGEELWGLYEEYHHLVNPLPQEEWVARLQSVGFEVQTVIPIVPEVFARAFLFFDELWHVRYAEGELGPYIHRYLGTLPNFTDGVSKVLEGLWRLSPNLSEGAGVIVLARKRE